MDYKGSTSIMHCSVNQNGSTHHELPFHACLMFPQQSSPQQCTSNQPLFLPMFCTQQHLTTDPQQNPYPGTCGEECCEDRYTSSSSKGPCPVHLPWKSSIRDPAKHGLMLLLHHHLLLPSCVEGPSAPTPHNCNISPSLSLWGRGAHESHRMTFSSGRSLPEESLP